MSKKLQFSKCGRIRSYGLIALGILVVFGLVKSAVVSAPDDFAYMSKARSINTGKLGVANPVGLAYSPSANALLISGDRKPGEQPMGYSGIVAFSLLREKGSSLNVAAEILDPLNICFSPQANGLIVLDKSADQLIKISVNPDGRLTPSDQAVVRYDAGRFPIQDPQGITCDPETGELYVLDSVGPRIFRLIPGPGQDFNSAGIEWVPMPALKLTGTAWPGRIAFNPENRHLYLFNPVDHKLFELTGTGAVVSVRDLSSLKLIGPQAMVFAPSGDRTDDRSIMSLYIADSGLDIVQGKSRGQVIELSLKAPVLSASVLAAPTVTGTLVNTIDLSLWSSPCPDPAGVTYNPVTNRFWVSDSEIEDATVYQGYNLFEMTPLGSLIAAYSTTGFTWEPAGLARNDTNGHLLFSDDDADKVFDVNLGADGIFGTADDVVANFSTTGYGATDSEGIDFDTDNGALLIADGTNAEVYVVDPGSNGVFNGGGDDVVTHFDTSALNMPNTDGITYSEDSRTLFVCGPSRKTIVEITLDGTLMRVIDVHTSGVVAADGLGYGPSSADSSKRSLYLADRAYDPSANPDENDGKIYEFLVVWPQITSFNPIKGPAGTGVTLTGIGFNGATEVSFNGTSATFIVNLDTKITATVPEGATTGPISVTTSGGTGTSSENFTVLLPPTVTSFNPTGGLPGTEVTVLGTDFTGATAVKFNGTSATFNVDSDTSITTTVPAGATTGPISVTTPGGTGTSSTDFIVAQLPVVTSFDPTSGFVGTVVTVTGANFTGATDVKFNGTSASFNVVSDTSITTTVPAGATTGPISVTTPPGTGTSSGNFTVKVSPTVTSITPNVMNEGDRIFVTITGTKFRAGSVLSFENGKGNAPTILNFNFIDRRHIRARIWVKPGGPDVNRRWDVVVTNPNGGRGVLVKGLLVQPR